MTASVRPFPRPVTDDAALWCPSEAHDDAIGPRLWKLGWVQGQMVEAACTACHERDRLLEKEARPEAELPEILLRGVLLIVLAVLLAMWLSDPTGHTYLDEPPAEGVTVGAWR